MQDLLFAPEGTNEMKEFLFMHQYTLFTLNPIFLAKFLVSH